MELYQVLDDAQTQLRETLAKLYQPGAASLAGLAEAARAVALFHSKNNVSETQYLRSTGTGVTEQQALSHAAATLSTIAEELLKHSKTDVRALRAHLVIEECAELISAMSTRDEVQTLDALADLLYVLLGTAVTFDLPIGPAFIEVHSSNMTKTKSAKDPHGQRLRDKGPKYRPADLASVLLKYRIAQFSPHVWNDEVGECINCGMSFAQIQKQGRKYGRLNCKGHHA